MTPENARQQAKVLMEAGAQSPVLPLRNMLRQRGIEWDRAARLFEQADLDELEVEIHFAGALEPGMVLYTATKGAAKILRTTNQAGVPSAQVHAEGFAQWENFISPSSPAVVVVSDVTL